jgi:3-phosphoshikimate 1-carboxyvinyltransferase
VQVQIQPSKISGTVTAPASKSSMQRACAAAFLHEGKTIIKNPGKSNDDIAALGIIQSMGASILKQGEEIHIQTLYKNNRQTSIDCGESGLSIRMFAALAAIDKILLPYKGLEVYLIDQWIFRSGISVITSTNTIK